MIKPIVGAVICVAAGVVIGMAGVWSLALPKSGSASESDASVTPPQKVNSTAVSALNSKGATKASAQTMVTAEGIPVVTSLAETASITSEFEQSAALYQLAAPLGANGIRALLDDAKSALSDGDYLGGTFLLIGRYAELDFAAALSYALENAGPALERWLTAIFHAQARIDVDEAVAQALRLSTNQQRIAGIAILRSNDNLTQAQRISIVETLRVPAQMAAVAQHNSEEAWHELRNIENPMQRIGAQSQVLMKWGRSDPWAALAASEEIDSMQMRQALQGSLLALAAADDSQRVMDWLNALPADSKRNRLTKMIVGQLSASNPEAAEVLINQLPAADRAEAEVGLWTQRAMKDPEGAAAWIESLPNNINPRSEGRIGRSASNQILMMLGMTSMESAGRFMQALPATRRVGLESVYVGLLAQNDPNQAARRVAQIADDQTRLSASMNLVHRWADDDPNAASRWVSKQSGEGVEQLYNALGSSWGRQDIEAARTFAEDMSSGAARDQMFLSILRSGQADTDEIAAMIEEIENPQLRSGAERLQQMRQELMSGVLSDSSKSVLDGLMEN